MPRFKHVYPLVTYIFKIKILNRTKNRDRAVSFTQLDASKIYVLLLYILMQFK